MEEGTRRFVRILRERTPGPWRQGFAESWDVWDENHCIAHCGPKRNHSYGMTSSLLNSRFIAAVGTCGYQIADLIEAVSAWAHTPNTSSESGMLETYNALEAAFERFIPSVGTLPVPTETAKKLN